MVEIAVRHFATQSEFSGLYLASRFVRLVILFLLFLAEQRTGPAS